MTAPTPEDVERVARELEDAVRDARGWWALAAARWHLAHSTPAPDERRKRVVETARALFVHLDAGHRGDPEKDLARSFDLARGFETVADAYLADGGGK